MATLSQFRTTFPELASVSDVDVQRELTRWGSVYSAAAWGSLHDSVVLNASALVLAPGADVDPRPYAARLETLARQRVNLAGAGPGAARDVGYDDTQATALGSTNVQGALDGVKGSLTTLTAAVAAVENADGVTYDDSVAPALGATDVQAALDVLKNPVTPTAHITSSGDLPATTDRSNTVDTTAGVVTLGLLTAAPNGRQYLIQKTNTGTNKITLDPEGAETINGVAAPYDLPDSDQAVRGRWHAFKDSTGNWQVG